MGLELMIKHFLSTGVVGNLNYWEGQLCPLKIHIKKEKRRKKNEKKLYKNISEIIKIPIFKNFNKRKNLKNVHIKALTAALFITVET